MSLGTETAAAARVVRLSNPAASASPSSEPGYQVIRRNGSVSPFDASKITVALTKAFLAVEGSSAAASRRVHDIVAELTDQIVASLTRRADAGRTFHVEDIQDQAELALMRSEHHKVARAPVFAEADNPFPWMSEAMDLKKEKNFFETRVIEYQNGGALAWE